MRIPLQIFNETKLLFYLSTDKLLDVTSRVSTKLDEYERDWLNISYTNMRMNWTFTSALLYAQTICTTIGYGHVYAETQTGRLLTMLYALVGIPLVFGILADLGIKKHLFVNFCIKMNAGKVLTKCLKYPWWLLKCGVRRLFRYCTQQSLDDIKKLDEADKNGVVSK